MIKIYHNPSCSKSRQALEILHGKGLDIEVIKYLEEVPSKEEIQEILKLLKIPALDLVRKNEPVWKENYKDKKLSEEEIIKAMIKNPKLIERPIVINQKKAAIARPTEKIETIL